jgi:hypothetical protein
MTRQTHTPAEKAQAALDVSSRKLTALTKKRDALAEEVKALNVAIDDERAQHVYLGRNPALGDAQVAIPTQPDPS